MLLADLKEGKEGCCSSGKTGFSRLVGTRIGSEGNVFNLLGQSFVRKGTLCLC